MEHAEPLKRRHLIVLALILAQILAVIWYFRYLPMVDLPQHLFTAKVLTHYSDPATAYDQFFTKKFPWNPYASYFWFSLALEPLMGVLNTTRLYLSLTLILTVVAFGTWMREVLPGRDAQMIPGTLLLLGLFFYVGLINYLFSIPFMFFSFALSHRLGRMSQPARKIEFLLLLSLLVTYFSHVVTFMITLFVIGIQQLVVFRGKGTFRLVRVAAIPTALMIFYMLFGLTGDVVGFGLMWDPFRQRIAYLLMPLNVFTDTLDHSWVYQTQSVVSWSAFIGIAILGGSGKIRASLFTAALVAALLVVAMLSFPTMIALSSGSPRLAYPAAFALLALLPVGWDLRPVLRWIVAGICLMYPLLFGYRVAGFQKEMAGFEKVIEAIPAHQAIQPVVTDLNSEDFRSYPYLHITVWYNYYKGGTNPYLFSHVPHFPIKDRRRVMTNPPGEWGMAGFKYEQNQEGTDYFIVKTRRADVIEDLSRHVPLVATSGDWMAFGPNPKK